MAIEDVSGRFAVTPRDLYDMSNIRRVFVLDPECDPHACFALAAYASHCQHENPALSQQLAEWAASIALPAGSIIGSHVSHIAAVLQLDGRVLPEGADVVQIVSAESAQTDASAD